MAEKPVVLTQGWVAHASPRNQRFTKAVAAILLASIAYFKNHFQKVVFMERG